MTIESAGPQERGWDVSDCARHREIAHRARAEDTVTKLVGTLRAGETPGDLVVGFTPPRRERIGPASSPVSPRRSLPGSGAGDLRARR